MRRFVAYLTAAATMLVAVGVSAGPVFTQINSGREFKNGREITFRLTAESDNLTSQMVDNVATEMRSRLDAFNFEDYSVKIQNTGNGEDGNSQSIAVSFSCDKDLFNFTCKYLSFSGTNFAFTTSDDISYVSDAIDYENAYTAQYNGLVPFVIIPINEEKKSEFEDLLTKTSTSTEGGETGMMLKRSAQMVSADGEAPQEGTPEGAGQPDIFLWANLDDLKAENFSTAQTDPYAASKLIIPFSASQIWLTEDEAKECGIINYEEKTAIKIVCGSMSEDGQSYDFGKLKNANTMANYYVNMIKATKYPCSISCDSVNIGNPQFGVFDGFDYFENATIVPATAEELLNYHANKVDLAFGATLIGTLVILLAVSVAFAFYYRFPAIAAITTTVSSMFLTYLVFIGLEAVFGTPALIGGLIIGLSSIVGEIYYLNKLKDELYKGRNLKKANQEASKKNTSFCIDTAVITGFSGLMTYLLGGVSLKPLGVILFFGAFINLLMNLTVFKGLMSLLCSSSLKVNYNNFRIREEKIPNLMMEQKPNYVAPFEKTQFNKAKPLASLIFAILSVVSVAGIIVFGSISGSPLNVKTAMQDKTVVSVRVEKNDYMTTPTEFKNYGLIIPTIDGFKNDDIDENKIQLFKVSQINEENITKTDDYFLFTLTLNKNYSSSTLGEIKTTISDNIAANVSTLSNVTVDVYNSKELIYTPNQGLVALATGVSIAVACVYLAIRFRPSRAIPVFAVTVGSSAIAYGLAAIFSQILLGTTAVTSLAMPLIAFASLFASLIFMHTEKSMLIDNREELTIDVRKSIMEKAVGKSVLPIFVFAIIAVFISIYCFGLGLQTASLLFFDALFGELIAVAALVILVGPWGLSFDKLFSKFGTPKAKKEQKTVAFEPKQKSSEPEETIFIGIND